MPNAARPGPSSLAVWIALATVYVLWGSTYLGIAIAIESLPPFLMAAMRFAIAGGLLLGWELVRTRGALPRPTLRELRDSAIVGTLLLGVANGFVGLGETSVPSGIAAILIALIPLWFAILGRIYFKERLSRLTAIGIGVGFLGVVLLAWPSGQAGDLDLFGVAILLVAPVAWSHGSLFAARAAKLPRRPLYASGLQMLLAAAVLLGEAAVLGEFSRFDPGAVTDRSLLALAYLIVFGSLVAYNAYTWLLRNAPLPLVGTYAYVNPVVALLLGAVFLSEPISPRTLLASGVIVLAVAMIVTARSRAQDAATDADDASETGETPSATEPTGRREPAGLPERLSLTRPPATRPGSSG